MFLFDWFDGILSSLGLRQKDSKEARIMLLGRNNADKTTLLRMLKGEVLIRELNDEESETLDRYRHFELIPLPDYMYQSFVRYQQTRDSTSEELSIGKIKFKVFDLGGHQIARRVWEDYNAKVDAVVYVVRASDRERLDESRTELEALLSDESLANVPFLILADVSFYRISEELLLSRLGLTNFTTGKGKVNLGDTNVRPLELFMYTLIWGHIDGFKWLSQYIK